MSTSTRPPTYRPRVIEHGDDTSGPQIRLPEQWLRGVLAGAEALILTWLVLTVPTVAVYIATAASPALGSAGWSEAAQVGTSIWFLAHGAPLSVGGLAITIVPLGLTALFAFLVSASVRRARLDSWTPAAVAAGTYVLLGAALLLLIEVPGASWGVLGSAGVAGLGAWWGMRGRAAALPARVVAVVQRCPSWVAIARGAVLRILFGSSVLALVTMVVAVVAGFDRILAIHRSLQTDLLSDVVLVLAHLAAVPVLMIWSLAFVAGPGFAVGQGTMFSAHGIESGPLPLLPALGALPEPGSLAADLPVLAGAIVAIGVIAGLWVARRTAAAPMWHALAAIGIGVGGSVLVLTAGAALASGGIGPGSMAVVGPAPWAFAAAVGWQLGAGGLLGVILLHPATRRQIRRAISGLRALAGR